MKDLFILWPVLWNDLNAVPGTSGAMAYTVGYEHSLRSLDGGPAEASTLQVTHIYRREKGEWKIVHRHGDVLPVDQSPTP